MLIRRQKCHHPPIHLADLDFADDIAQLEETICQAERVLHKVEAETLSILLINVQKTKYMSVKSFTVEPSFKTMNESELEMVEDFKYLGSYSQTLTEINTRMAQAGLHYIVLKNTGNQASPQRIK